MNLLTLICTGLLMTPSANDGYIRVDQLGYRPLDPKIALLMTNDDLGGTRFQITGQKIGGRRRLGFGRMLPVGQDRGSYGGFAHVYELDFSKIKAPGSFRLKVPGQKPSPIFAIDAGAYDSVVSTALEFFRVQRCGDTNPSQHGACHLNPGIAVGGSNAGTLVPNQGGWHDAGDYLKFLGEESATALFLLESFLHAPERFDDTDSNGIPDVLEEARIALEWFQVMWDPSTNNFYHQVSNGADDHYPWRLPEVDDSDPSPAKSMRKTYACEPGKGANFAGRTSAALAIGSRLFGNPAATYYDPVFSSSCQLSATQLYAFGMANQAVQNPPGGGFEFSWRDDMGLAAVELYANTGTANYLDAARTWVSEAGNVYYFNAIGLHAFANYRLAQEDPSFLATAINMLRIDALYTYSYHAGFNVFNETLDQMQWGSLTEICARGLEMLLYEELSGDDQLHGLALDQWHYNFGLNPFGVSFVNGLGSTWSKYPHHQVVDPTLNPSTTGLLGFWNEGPIEGFRYFNEGIVLGRDDAYAEFQTSFAIYHDDLEDYVTNEPTVIANGIGIAFAAWL